MKLTDLLIIFSILLSTNSFGQLTPEQEKDSRRFRNNYARAIDQQDTLINNCILTFSHSTSLECIHMTDTSGTINVVSIRPRDYPGYVNFHSDFEGHVIFEYRGDGSGNPLMFFSVSKIDGNSTWLQKSEYPK